MLRILNVFPVKVKWYSIFTYPALKHPHYSSTDIELEMKLEGMVCGLCAVRAEQAIARLPEVEKVSVDFDSQKVKVELKEANLTPFFIRKMQDSVDEVVLAKNVRRALEKVQKTLNKKG